MNGSVIAFSWILMFSGHWLQGYHDRYNCEISRTYSHPEALCIFVGDEVRSVHHHARRHHHLFDESVTYYHRHTHIED